MRNTLRFVCFSAMVAAAGGCGDNNMASSDGGGGNPDMAQAVPNCATGVICSKSTIADQTLDLNTSTTGLMFTVIANAGYSGMVNVTVDSSSISALPGGGSPSIQIAPVPGVFQLTGGVPAQVTLNVSAATDAAAFTGKVIKLHVADMADATKSFDLPFNLTVNPAITISFTGDGTNTLHTWSTDTVATLDAQKRYSFNVRQRTGGTTFTFTNLGTGNHVVHGSGVILHEGQGAAPPPTSLNPNQSYVLPGINDATLPARTFINGFYCHSQGTGSSTMGTERFVTFIP